MDQERRNQQALGLEGQIPEVNQPIPAKEFGHFSIGKGHQGQLTHNHGTRSAQSKAHHHLIRGGSDLNANRTGRFSQENIVSHEFVEHERGKR